MLGVLLAAMGASAWARDWPQLQADSCRTGRTTDEVRQVTPGQSDNNSGWRLKWAWSGDDLITRGSQPLPKKATAAVCGLVQPIAAEGRVFFGALDGGVYAVDLEEGKQLWRFPTGGPICHTAAWTDGVVIVTSADSSVYGIDAETGKKLWNLQTGAALVTAPCVADGMAYVSGRDGFMYALEAKTGALLWKRNLGAPMQNSPAVGLGKLFVGSEDMVFHAIDIRDGNELWRHPVMGQSIWHFFPVVDEKNRLVAFHTMSVVGGAENACYQAMENLLASLPENNWPAEREALLKHLKEEAPDRRNFYVLNADTGEEPFFAPAALVGGNNDVPMPPVIDNQGRMLIYWRTKSSRFIGGTFGTKWPPDIGPVDTKTGDRIKLDLLPDRQAIELDNNFFLTVGGACLYGSNHFRGAWYMDMRPGTGKTYGVSRPYAIDRDGGYPLAEGAYSLYPDRADPVTGPAGAGTWSGLVPVGEYLLSNETYAKCIAVYEGVGKEAGQ
jgi:outer membrane protein assembly factor BamB